MYVLGFRTSIILRCLVSLVENERKDTFSKLPFHHPNSKNVLVSCKSAFHAFSTFTNNTKLSPKLFPHSGIPSKIFHDPFNKFRQTLILQSQTKSSNITKKKVQQTSRHFALMSELHIDGPPSTTLFIEKISAQTTQ